MRHWWNRTPEEQDAIARWVRGEAPPPLLAAKQAREAERVAHQSARARHRCTACGGSGQVLLMVSTRTEGRVGATVPCNACRAEEHAETLANIRRAALERRAAAPARRHGSSLAAARA
jgi:hypothetical protein